MSGRLTETNIYRVCTLFKHIWLIPERFSSLLGQITITREAQNTSGPNKHRYLKLYAAFRFASMT
jgi:hypothetical protein